MVAEDFLAAMKYLLKLKKGDGVLDDIDHLGSRRVRAVGELLANQCRVGLARTERLVKERMTLFDVNIEGMTPQKLINPKALSAVVRDFFVVPSFPSSWTKPTRSPSSPTSAVFRLLDLVDSTVTVLVSRFVTFTPPTTDGFVRLRLPRVPTLV